MRRYAATPAPRLARVAPHNILIANGFVKLSELVPGFLRDSPEAPVPESRPRLAECAAGPPGTHRCGSCPAGRGRRYRLGTRRTRQEQEAPDVASRNPRRSHTARIARCDDNAAGRAAPA